MSNGPIRIAHLILTHKNPAQLGRMLKALYHEAFDFYIHVDAKADIAPFLPLGELPNVYFIKNRARVAWADFGTIQATLNGWREILPLGKHDYINVISGQDFPVRSAETIYRFIASRNGQEFITCESIDSPNWNVGPRVRNYHLINWRIPGKFRLEKILNKVLPERKFPVDHVWVGRANWFTLSAKAIQYCLDFLRDHPKVVRYYKYCWGADEFIFSTILYNSPVFRDRILDNLVYVDWPTPGAGHPKMLDAGDIEKLKATDKMFARKMDLTTDPELFRLLEEWIGSPAGSQDGSMDRETSGKAGGATGPGTQARVGTDSQDGAVDREASGKTGGATGQEAQAANGSVSQEPLDGANDKISQPS